MNADEWVEEIVVSYFDECARMGELMGDADAERWVTETIDGASLTDLDDTELIALADRGLDSMGEPDFSGGVRCALEALVFYVLISKTHERIRELVKEYDLDLADALATRPHDEDNKELHEGEDHEDGEYRLWRQPTWAVWKHVEELGLWADFTAINPPPAVEKLREAVSR